MKSDLLLETSLIHHQPHAQAIVVGIQLATQSRHEIEEDLKELSALLQTLGITTHASIIQRRQKLVARSLLGSGKLIEIREMAQAAGVDYLVFNRELTGVQTRNLEKDTGLKVYDRTGVILEIFSEHARTNQAKAQVEIARLEYLLPRLTGAWTHFQRQTGGRVKSRGMGEKQIEIDRRRARERIVRLQKQLLEFEKEQATQSKRRRNEFKVALVGYTNSGKTTLMNELTKQNFYAKDELFATLDASIKVINPQTRPKILLSDTVGFIRNLPHSLVESFKSTLAHLKEADLLLHVVDISYPHYKEHMRTTEKVLQEVGAGDIPTMLVFNKIDLIEDPMYPRILKSSFPHSLVVTAYDPQSVSDLREQIYQFFIEHMTTVQLIVPVERQDVISLVYNKTLVLDSDYQVPGHVIFHVQASQSILDKLADFVDRSVNHSSRKEAFA